MVAQEGNLFHRLHLSISLSPPSLAFLRFSEARHVAVGLQRSQQDVDEPQGEEEQSGEQLGGPRPPELSSRDRGPTAVQQREHTAQCQHGEECDGESQRARWHVELPTFAVPIDRGDGPRHADAQEDIHSIAARHIADGGIGVLVLDGSHFAGKGV